MTAKPLLYDLFCKAGGTTKGYQQAGFRVIGVDIEAQPHHCGDGFIQMDWLEFMQRYMAGEFERAQAFHASPPCQFASTMRNLPWNVHKDYPALIKPVRDRLKQIGLPWVLENVYTARWGSKQLAKYQCEEHGMQAGWLCGTMFQRPFYRHRLFEANWLWLAPEHPKHVQVIKRGPLFGNNGGRLTQVVFSEAEDARGIETWPGRRKDGDRGHGMAPVRQYTRLSGPNAGKVETTHTGGVTDHVVPQSLAAKQQGNGAQAAGVGVGHAKGWRLAAEAMGIDWCNRAELTQAIPPVYTKFIGEALFKQCYNTDMPSPTG